MKTPKNRVLFVINLCPSKKGMVKYAQPEDRQFRVSLKEICSSLEDSGARVYFARIADIAGAGEIEKLYRIDKNSKDESLAAFIPIEIPDFQPDLIINRVKDQLYDHPAYQAFINNGVVIINSKEVAKLGNKALASDIFRSYQPPTIVIDSPDIENRRKAIKGFLKAHGTIVVKPYRDNGGRGIVIADQSSSADLEPIMHDENIFVAQKYIETNKGVEGFVQGRHDVRLYIVGGRIITASTRRPKEGSRLSNTAQGGSIVFHSKSQIPVDLARIAEKIISGLNLPAASFISLDFFFGDGKWYLIEANDQPGMPALYQHKSSADIQKAFVTMCVGALL